MSNRLITDSFPKTKKEKTITKTYRKTKLESSVKPIVHDKGDLNVVLWCTRAQASYLVNVLKTPLSFVFNRDKT